MLGGELRRLEQLVPGGERISVRLPVEVHDGRDVHDPAEREGDEARRRERSRSVELEARAAQAPRDHSEREEQPDQEQAQRAPEDEDRKQREHDGQKQRLVLERDACADAEPRQERARLARVADVPAGEAPLALREREAEERERGVLRVAREHVRVGEKVRTERRRRHRRVTDQRIAREVAQVPLEPQQEQEARDTGGEDPQRPGAHAEPPQALLGRRRGGRRVVPAEERRDHLREEKIAGHARVDDARRLHHEVVRYVILLRGDAGHVVDPAPELHLFVDRERVILDDGDRGEHAHELVRVVHRTQVREHAEHRQQHEKEEEAARRVP